LEEFRNAQPARTKLPESLGEAVVELARQHNIYAVAHSLGLDYTRLKQRLGGNPIVQNNPKLKLRCLVVKGDVDMDFDDGLAQVDWTAALALAKSLNDPGWETCASGELGIISFLQGDHAGAVMSVGNVLSSATKSGDIGAQIRYLTLIGSGLTEFGRPEQALNYLDRALKLVASTPDLADPVLSYTEKARALADIGREQEATTLLQSVLSIARERRSYGYQADLLIQIARLSLKAARQSVAIEQLQEAIHLTSRGCQ
jgi:tetratricopeptide (TPR) repeat protein